MKPIATVITAMPEQWRRNAASGAVATPASGEMSTAEARRFLNEAPPSPALVRATAEAERCADLRAAYGRGFGHHLVAHPMVVQEAQRRLQAVKAILAPALVEEVVQWLNSLDLLCDRKEDAPPRDKTVQALVGALDLPECSYTRESLRAVARSPDGKPVWFPGYGHLVAALEPFAKPYRRAATLLEMVASAAPPAAAPRAERLTEEQQRSVAQIGEQNRPEAALETLKQPSKPPGRELPSEVQAQLMAKNPLVQAAKREAQRMA